MSIPKIVPSCVNCGIWSENYQECQLVREQGLTVCSYWPLNTTETGEKR